MAELKINTPIVTVPFVDAAFKVPSEITENVTIPRDLFAVTYFIISLRRPRERADSYPPCDCVVSARVHSLSITKASDVLDFTRQSTPVRRAATLFAKTRYQIFPPRRSRAVAFATTRSIGRATFAQQWQ